MRDRIAAPARRRRGGVASAFRTELVSQIGRPSIPLHDELQVRHRTKAPYRLVIANGPPDTKTFDRRRVDPPAGCRAAAEPAHLPVRRSVDDPPS